MTTFVLLSSPLLGLAAWSPVSAAFRERGVDVLDVPPMGFPPGSPRQVSSHLLEAIPAEGRFVLVPHSNAGLFVPGLTVARPVAGSVFVDAVLPPTSGEAPVAPEALLRFLSTLTDEEGILPPWTQWWGDEDIEGLYPSDEVRLSLERESPRLPLSYFRSSVDVPAGWDRRPGAYLAFGDTYGEDRERAAGLGWPTATIRGGHLHQLHDPGVVADRILRLAEEADIGLGSNPYSS